MQKIEANPKSHIPQGPRGPLLVDKVELTLREKVAQLQNVPNAKLPEEKVLAKTHGVSVKTIRCALDRLRNDRVIRSIRGKGTFVSSDRRELKKNVYIVCYDPHHPYKMMGVSVISSLLNKEGLRPSLIVSEKPEEELKIGDESVMGAILIGIYSREAVSKLLHGVNIPFVYVGDFDQPVRVPSLCDNIVPDHRSLGFCATEHLVRQGHTRIAVCGWSLSKAWGRDLLQGHRNALELHGLSANEDWFIDLPKVPFEGPARNEEIFHQPLGQMQHRIDRWFETGDYPTAIIHNCAGELQIREMLHHYFHDRFAPESVVAVTYTELLEMAYNGFGKGAAVCIRFENLARRALELLRRPRDPHRPPFREFQEHVHFYLRNEARWELQQDIQWGA